MSDHVSVIYYQCQSMPVPVNVSVNQCQPMLANVGQCQCQIVPMPVKFTPGQRRSILVPVNVGVSQMSVNDSQCQCQLETVPVTVGQQ